MARWRSIRRIRLTHLPKKEGGGDWVLNKGIEAGAVTVKTSNMR